MATKQVRSRTRYVESAVRSDGRRFRRNEAERKAAEYWAPENLVPLDEIEVPPSFRRSEAMRLWYLDKCGPQGEFEHGMQSQQFPGIATIPRPYSMHMGTPIMRRIGLARKLAPLVLPEFLSFVWNAVGPRITIQLAVEIMLGFFPALGTYSQGLLVDAVQRSLYSHDVPPETLIKYTILSIFAANLPPVIQLIVSRNAMHCNHVLGGAIERANLQIHLDIDLPSSSDPIVNRLLQDCNAFASSGGDHTSSLNGNSQLYSFIVFLSSLTNISSSLLLCLTTLRLVVDFGFSFSTLLFLCLALFPVISNDLLRRARLTGEAMERHETWQKANVQKMIFQSIGTNFLYKQDVLMFGLRDWVVSNWEKNKIESEQFDPYTTSDGFLRMISMTPLPHNIVKDVLHALLGLHFFANTITLGSLHVMQSSTSNIYWQIMTFRSQFNEVISNLFRIAAFFETRKWVQEMREGGDRIVEYKPKLPAPDRKRGMKIEIRGLSFRYPGTEHDVLKNVNLTIEEGQTVAIVGFNGGGKTTLAKIMTGLYNYEGSMLIDGVEARSYILDTLHRYMTVCPQQFSQFPLTLRENIGLGQVKHIEDLSIIRGSARRGGAEDVIDKHGLEARLSNGPGSQWDFMPVKASGPTSKTTNATKEKVKEEEVKEKVDNHDEATEKSEKPNGVAKHGATENGKAKPDPDHSNDNPIAHLSGGELQRVALSRAFMRADEATLVVLDEPSAALDARAEYELFERIYALSKGDGTATRTTVYISHRFSTVRRADKIAVVEGGTVTEFGTHAELMELGGRYAELFLLQMKALTGD